MKLDRIIAVRNDKTIFRDGELCLKVFGPSYTKSEVLGEAMKQALVAEAGLRIPEIREVTQIDGKFAIISDYIKGKTIAQLIVDDPDNKHDYLKQFTAAQVGIHAKSCPSLLRLKDKLNADICLTDFDATTRYDLHSKLEEMPRHLKLCHGDYLPENVILSDSGEAYIIDWHNASQGNASADAALTTLHLKLDGDDETAEEYLSLFCEMSQTAREYVDRWMPIVAASRLATANKREREFLRPIVGRT